MVYARGTPHETGIAGTKKNYIQFFKLFLCRSGEMVYALVSGTSGSNPVEVQVLSTAPGII